MHFPPPKPLTPSSALRKTKAGSDYKEVGQPGPEAKMRACVMGRGAGRRQHRRQRRQLLPQFCPLLECAPYCTLVQRRNQLAPGQPGSASQGGSFTRVAQIQAAPAASKTPGQRDHGCKRQGAQPSESYPTQQNRTQSNSKDRSTPGNPGTRTPAQLLYSGTTYWQTPKPGTQGPARPEHTDT